MIHITAGETLPFFVLMVNLIFSCAKALDIYLTLWYITLRLNALMKLSLLQKSFQRVIGRCEITGQQKRASFRSRVGERMRVFGAKTSRALSNRLRSVPLSWRRACLSPLSGRIIRQAGWYREVTSSLRSKDDLGAFYLTKRKPEKHIIEER